MNLLSSQFSCYQLQNCIWSLFTRVTSQYNNLVALKNTAVHEPFTKNEKLSLNWEKAFAWESTAAPGANAAERMASRVDAKDATARAAPHPLLWLSLFPENEFWDWLKTNLNLNQNLSIVKTHIIFYNTLPLEFEFVRHQKIINPLFDWVWTQKNFTSSNQPDSHFDMKHTTPQFVRPEFPPKVDNKLGKSGMAVLSLL